MRIWPISFLVICHFGIASFSGGAAARAEDRLVLKSGESLELHPVYFVANCQSIMIGMPELEILEGPTEVTLSVKEEMVLPRRFNCAKPVKGGKVVATAKDIKEQMQTKLTYRINYKTKDGPRQTSRIYGVSLYP
jgi:hypothetical protein